MMEWGWGGGDGWGTVGILLSLLILAAIVVGAVLVVRALLHGSTQPTSPHVTALAPEAPTPATLRLLSERYARGEIDRDEYLLRKQDLIS